MGFFVPTRFEWKQIKKKWSEESLFAENADEFKIPAESVCKRSPTDLAKPAQYACVVEDVRQ